MKNIEKTKEELLEEIDQLRVKIAEMEKSESRSKQVKEALRISSLATETSMDAIFAADLKGMITYANTAAVKMWGYKNAEEMIGTNAIEYWTKSTQGRAEEIIGVLLKDGYIATSGELIGKRLNGTEFIIESNSVVVKDEKGKLVGMIGSFIDITERKLAGEALLNSENNLRTLFNAMTDIVFEMDHDGRYVNIAPTSPELMFKPSEEVIGKTLYEVFPKPEADKFLEFIRKCLDENKINTIEYPLTINDKTIWFEGRATPKTKNSVLYIARDINERKQAELELRQSEERFKRLFDGLGDAVYVTKIGGKNKGRILEVNPAAVKQTGYSRDELLQMNIIRDLYISGSGEINTDDWEEKLNKGEIVTTTERKRKKDGSEFWTEVIVAPIEFKEEKASLSINHNITERKKVEEDLRKSEHFLNSILESVQDGVSVLNPDLTVRHVNGVMKKWYKENLPLKGKKCYKVYHNSDKPCDPCPTLRCLESGCTEWNVVPGLPGSSVVWIELFSYPIKDQNSDKVTGVVEFVRDITERKRAEQIQKVLYNISNAVITTNNLTKLICQIQEELGTIINTANFYVAIYDRKTDTFSLPFFADEKDEFLSFPAGKTLTNYVIKTQESLLATKERIKKLEKSEDVNAFGIDSEIWLGVPLKYEGEVIGVLAVQSYSDENAFDESDMKMLEFVSDQISISIDRKKVEQNLINALEKATESDRLKSAFLATISHELRTPLNAIIGFSDIIDEDLPVKEIIDIAKTINSSGIHLLNIVEDLFNISLIESGEVKIVKENVELQPILNDVHEIIKIEQQKTDKNNLELKLSIPQEEKNLTINTDPSKLAQILINLLKNALKFTPQGYIHYGYRIETDQGKRMLKFYVEDSGIGIPEDKQELIFDVFRQAEDSHARTYGGTGIGLSISKKLTELLGGKIWLESEKGKGSTLYFMIPYGENC